MTLGEASVGSLVYFRVNGEYTAFRVMHHGKPDDTYDNSYAGGTILMMDHAAGVFNTYMVATGTTVKGDYSGSYMHRWLNDTFMGYLDPVIAEQVVEVKLPYRKGVGTDPYVVASGSDGLPAKAWIPSIEEAARMTRYVIGYGPAYIIEGAKFDYWKDAGTERYQEWCCYDDSGADAGWGLRTPNNYTSNDYAMYFFKVSASGDAYSAVSNAVKIRPCLVLPDTLRVDGDRYVQAGTNVPVKVGGAWKDGASWVKQGGVWRETASLHAKVDGTWKV